jgi:hypothetical protein
MAQIRLQASAANKEHTVTYAITSGSLPSGMTLNAATGVVSGTPSTVGYNVAGVASSVTITATNTATSQTTNRSFSIVRRWKDGSSRSFAATSAQSIKDITGTTTDADYWLQPSGCPRPFLSHCFMSIESGGWQLVVRIRTDITTNGYGLGRSMPFTAEWAGWGASTQDEIENYGYTGQGAADSYSFNSSFAYSSFRDVMVIANDSAQYAKRLGWRHNVAINNMFSVTGGTSARTNGDSVLFGNPQNWTKSLYVRGDTNTGYADSAFYGFKQRADTGASIDVNRVTGGVATGTAMHYISMIGCGRDNSNGSTWGGGIGGLYTDGETYQIGGHWWGHGSSRTGGAWSGDRTQAFYGHGVYVRSAT